MTNSAFYPIIDDVKWLQPLFSIGTKQVQLRLKNLQPPVIEQQIKQAVNIQKSYPESILIINDYWQYAIDYGARFIHLGQSDLLNANLPELRKHKIKFGISTHTIPEIEIALNHHPDYIAIGPIFETTLKKMPYQPVGYELIKTARQKTNLPIVAIGGLTLSRAKQAQTNGADKVAVISAIFNAVNPIEEAKLWLNTL